MNKVTAFKVSLILTIVLNLLGTYFKIAHYPHGTLLLSISLIASLVFIILGLTDVFENENCRTPEKIMWTVGFIFLSWIAGLLYYPKFKKRNK
jgi:ABC-type polysaccharide/polyol phosphate export permease